MRSFLHALGAVLLLALLAASPAAAATGSYVSLGDSYTAGPLITTPVGSPLGCLRSSTNYPRLIAPSLTTAAFRDISCSGATTDDMTNEQSTELGTNPPQFSALNGEERVVTLGIGGNDIGFTSIIEECVNLNPFGTPCKNRFTAGGIDQISQRIAATAPKIDATIAGIQARSPSAKVFVVGYPTILPNSGFGCWPTVPILPQDVPYLRAKEQELNAMLSTRAAADGAYYVDTYTSSIGHDVCKATGTRWVEGLVPTSPAAPVHPNALGMQNSATDTLARINAVGY
jgi:lysophospholipase L1-like esterase